MIGRSAHERQTNDQRGRAVARLQQVVVGLVWTFSTAGTSVPYSSGVLMVGFLLVPLYWPLIGLL